MGRIVTWTMACLGLVASSAACGPPGGGGDPEPRQELTHQMVVDRMDANGRSMTRLASDSVRFAEDSELALHTADLFYGETCQPSGECTDETPNIDTSLAEPTDTTIEELKKLFFNEDSIVEQSETEITYGMDAEYSCSGTACATLDSGDFVCEGEDGAPSASEIRAACVSNVEEMNYQIEVWSPSEGNLNASMSIGPGHTPFEMELHTDYAAVTTELSELRKAIAHSDMVYKTSSAEEIPSTFEGTVYTLLEQQDSRKLHFEARVKSDINIGGNDIQFQLASAGKPVFGATADGSGELVSSTFNLGELEASFPFTYYNYDGETEQEVTLSHTAHLAGLTGRILFDGNDEHLKIQDLSLGDSTSWLEMAGERVMAVNLNAGSGRSFDLTAEATGTEDVFETSVSPEIDASIDLNFGRVDQQIDWMSEWIKDDVFDLSLTGSEPSVRWGLGPDDYGFIEVNNGTLELASEMPEYTRTVSSGSCLVGEDESNPKVSWYHPLEHLAQGSCP